jgi:hypothetical protein
MRGAVPLLRARRTLHAGRALNAPHSTTGLHFTRLESEGQPGPERRFAPEVNESQPSTPEAAALIGMDLPVQITMM